MNFFYFFLGLNVLHNPHIPVQRIYVNPIKIPMDVPELPSMPKHCVADIECEEPLRCCNGFIMNYCCNIGGTAQKTKRKTFPNITFPDTFPLPKPRPVPVPIPIPIPVPN